MQALEYREIVEVWALLSFLGGVLGGMLFASMISAARMLGELFRLTPWGARFDRWVERKATDAMIKADIRRLRRDAQRGRVSPHLLALFAIIVFFALVMLGGCSMKPPDRFGNGLEDSSVWRENLWRKL